MSFEPRTTLAGRARWLVVVSLLALLIAACGGGATPEPTNTPVPPTNTPVPPTATPIPPTDTAVPPTDTPVPPTDTPVPPTDTPEPEPTDTEVPAATPTEAEMEEPEETPEAEAEAEGPPVIPHELEGRDDCLQCHAVDSQIKPAPENHAELTNVACQNCHATEGGTPVLWGQEAPDIPHDLEGRDNCLQCHAPDGQIMPAPATHEGLVNTMCQLCHEPES